MQISALNEEQQVQKLINSTPKVSEQRVPISDVIHQSVSLINPTSQRVNVMEVTGVSTPLVSHVSSIHSTPATPSHNTPNRSQSTYIPASSRGLNLPPSAQRRQSTSTLGHQLSASGHQSGGHAPVRSHSVKLRNYAPGDV
jgi:hypothetical protein